jgi:hypothetical protein
MRLLLLLTLVVGTATLVLAQATPPSGSYYQPAVPPPSNVTAYGGGWGYQTGASTAAGSAMSGMASVISAAGDYNLATSAAAVNMTQAERNEIQNRQQATNAYFEMRATNRAARAAEAGPKPTHEQLVRIAREGIPKPPSTDQMDPVTGRIAWPGVLQTGDFESQRAEVDQLFAKRATQGGLTYAEQSKVRESIDAMLIELKGQIRDVPPQDYVASRGFLQSLSYIATRSEVQ